ncbi:MAG: hypothetical protein AAGF58_08190 [Pseudomonadota bacterium]
MKLLTVLLALTFFLGAVTATGITIDQASAACQTHDLKCKEEESENE